MKIQRLLFIFFSAALLCWPVILSLPKDSHAAVISLPATGETKCYNLSGTETACAGTGQDGDKKMGVAWPNPRFTVNGDCVTDNLTGLIWTKNANLFDAAKTWQQALDAVAWLNTSFGICGQTDWRLPQILELESLVHAGYNNEICGVSPCSSNADWLNTQGFINALSGSYWSSSTDAGRTYFAWYVDMHFGAVDYYFYKTDSRYVWPVRGGLNAASAEIWKTGQTKCYDASGAAIACAGTGQDGDKQKGVAWPSPRFTDNSNGTITDNLTGLIWLKNANCFFTTTWPDALGKTAGLANSQCGLSDGSQAGDWRLPNRKELLSLVDFSLYNPALPAGHPFTNAQSGNYWSSSTYVFDTNFIWAVGMGYGSVLDVFQFLSYYVWPVRGGQSGALCNLTISPSSQTFTSTGGTGSVTVTASAGSCAWTASSSLNWATITSGSSGTGNGTAGFTVSANTSGSGQRTGNITIAGQTFVITQSDTAFADVLSTNGFYSYINAIYNAHITVGCSQNPLMYCPDTGVTRGQMAAFIIRAKYGENFTYTQTPYFSDVPATNAFFKYVQRLKDDAITVVTGTYGVNDVVTRGQMAAFIIRAKYGENFTYTQAPYFSDVPATNVFFKYVQRLKDDAITVVTGTYGVNDVVTRGQMAAFIARAFLGMP